ncbi:hypothetical protein [Thermus scotoductus]|uniref:hypothetical protein n=1 Tax=Thermus scotoductus TaxID=37636 RepID=UPI00056E48F1|nr:hypothetical protein [Thermus scotoductus]
MRQTLLTANDFTPALEPLGQGEYVVAERKVPPLTVEEYRAGVRLFARVRAQADFTVDSDGALITLPVPGVRMPELSAGGVVLLDRNTLQEYPVFVGPTATPPSGYYGVVGFTQDGLTRRVEIYGPTFPHNFRLLWYPAQGLAKLRVTRKETGVRKDILQVDLFRLNGIDHDDREKVIRLERGAAAFQDRYLQVVVQGLVDEARGQNSSFAVTVMTLELPILSWDLNTYVRQLSRDLRRPLTAQQAMTLADAALARV